ncbi:DUF4129 domain-containing protein, partial [Microbacterium lacticum]|uniref:DUF4129 domain-containing protein n=1 Tax=Microbacterium lacticum TaxID=33885 RepID=UPI003A8AFDB8
GSAGAWRAVQDTAIDLGVSVPSSESPRALGARLVARHGAPAAEMSRLVAAIERASYAPPAGAAVDTRSMDAEASRATPFDDAAQIRRAMLAAVGARERVRAIVLPRSLVIRPGSAFADRDALA